ncbi:hypothetical protein Hanom_Chr04g00309341 [Helianthus anomalus]
MFNIYTQISTHLVLQLNKFIINHRFHRKLLNKLRRIHANPVTGLVPIADVTTVLNQESVLQQPLTALPLQTFNAFRHKSAGNFGSGQNWF